MDLGSMALLVMVGMALGAFFTKALFPRIEVREVEVEVKVEKQLSLLQALTVAFSTDPMKRVTLMGASEETLTHVRKALELVKDGFRPAKVGQAFKFYNPSIGKTLSLNSKGVWKDISIQHEWFSPPTPQQRRMDEESPY